MELNKENLTTIAVYIWMIISPILTTYGIVIDQSLFTGAIAGVLGLIIAVYSSIHPNKIKLFGNDTTETSSVSSDEVA